MEFRILGPLEVVDDGRTVALGGSKQRALLAILLLRANEVVSRDRLIEDLWGERAPETASTALHGYVSQLRKALKPRRGEDEHQLLITRAPGYLLRVDPEQFDLRRFERLVREAKSELVEGDAQAASRALAEGLALWRGPPLAELGSAPFALVESLRLQELRVSTLEDRVEADLALGRHHDLVAELETLAAEHPFRERLRGQLMLALYRSGRQAEALRTYQQARRLLADELGLEPGQELKQLEQAILRQDPTLTPALPAKLATEAERSLPPAAAAVPTREERKVVSVLFADLVDFTARAETLDPEDVRAIQDRYWAPVRAEIERHGGTVEKFAGDAVMALFGAPRTHEDDPERAVRAALAIRERARADGLKVRIAITTGEALVRLGAQPLAGEGIAAGDVINTAARL
jgi:DNA-binding SARP family transcriptional activator